MGNFVNNKNLWCELESNRRKTTGKSTAAGSESLMRLTKIYKNVEEETRKQVR